MQTTLKSRASAGLLALLTVGWTPLFGQTTTPSESDKKNEEGVVTLDKLVVTGLRGSLTSAAEIKQSKMEIVDAIVASDIDKLPDINVSYALSRVPGVQLAHTFSGLGGNGAVTIRGLNQITNTLDGRQVLTPGGIANGTAGVGVGQRNFDYSQIPSALIAGIDVYKTAAANQIDGGLGGLVNVRMRKPFDFPDGFGGGATVGTSYSSLHRKNEQNYNVFGNATAKTDFGKIGLLVAVSDIATPWREDAIGIGNPIANTTVTTGVATALSSSGYNVSSSYGRFKTNGSNTVLEWEPNERWQFYVGYNPNKWRNTQDTMQFTTALTAANSVAGSGVMFDGSNTAVRAASFANVTGTAYGLIRDLQNKLDMVFAGGRFAEGDLTVLFDANRFKSSNRFHNNLVFASVTIPSLSYDLAGEIPSVRIGGVSLQDPSVYRLNQVNYRLFPSNSEGKAARIDAEYNIKRGFLSKIVGGMRYSTTTSDNYPTGLFLGSFTIPGTANQLSQYPGLWRPTPVQDFFAGYSQPQIPAYLAGDTAIMRDANAFYKAYGATNTPDTSATVNRLSLFDIEETTTAFYVMPQFSGTVGGYTVEGNFGLRAVQTKEDTNGFQGPNSASAVPLNLQSSYWNYLPSFNGRVRLNDHLFFRAAFSKTITRPNFGSLSPSLTLNANPVNPALNSGSQGNPDLKPIRGTNVDLSLEYYFNKSDLVYVAAFNKDVKGFIASFSEQRTYDGVTYVISTSRNLNPATIKGLEVGFQHFFSSLPAPFDGLGLQANYTYVDSSTPTTVTGAGTVTTPLTNLSKRSYNIVAMYEKGPVSARLAYNYRADFVTGFAYFVNAGLLSQTMLGYADLDASFNYSLTKNLQFALQGVNLTNKLRYQVYGTKMVPSNIYLDGRQVLASVTLRF
ncbi:TonB-dependent receptor [Oleiharenicola lentus]|uniref:TonB-dependent receptor n=1 Tax=Oleiharenicola lentus TaxID=2508720 RepID=A0A4Q1C595_9BACT|nr:TonB-dependent receptor [Oleiharenicola lentus]RXK53590.1 TonB-dependent receptor [Oleiharenicola lentus]